MGLIRGEWLFPASRPPGIEQIAEVFEARTGLEVRCDNTDPGWLDIPLLRESLFELEDHPPDGIVLHSFIPAHPYLWVQLDKVMLGLGATASCDTSFWIPDDLHASLDLPWAKLTKRQRFALRRRAIGGWRPFDFLLRNGGGKR